jgi:hypothetical protein
MGFLFASKIPSDSPLEKGRVFPDETGGSCKMGTRPYIENIKVSRYEPAQGRIAIHPCKDMKGVYI